MYYAADVHYHAEGVASDVNTVEWVYTGLAPGVYDISATWYGHENRATDSPFSARDVNGDCC